MARKGRRKSGSGTYAKPIVAGNSTISIDLSTVLVTKNAFEQWVDTVGSTERHYLSITPSRLRSMARLLSCDAVKITSIIVSPGGSAVADIDMDSVTIDFTDGQSFICANTMKPTKVRPSQLSPAGRYLDGNSSTEIARIYCPFSIAEYSSSSPSKWVPYPKIVINISVRSDAYPTQLSP